jgi:hypothetical protein
MHGFRFLFLDGEMLKPYSSSNVARLNILNGEH